MNHHKRPRWPYLIILLPCAILLAMVLLQGPVAHLTQPTYPTYAMVDLADLWAQDTLTDDDYQTLLYQTGLGTPAVDKLRGADDGLTQLLAIQAQFFQTVTLSCDELLGIFTMEEHLVDDEGNTLWAPALVDLQPGDIILSLSTHTMGWYHGHAGLVISGEGDGVVLEAIQLGTNSALCTATHWRRYATFAVLRLKDGTPELGQQVADYGLAHLNDIPYSLLSGLGADKAPDPDDPDFTVHCDYLPWYAYQAFGYDLDSDGGSIVTTTDLLESPYLEVVQCYGLDLTQFS